MFFLLTDEDISGFVLEEVQLEKLRGAGRASPSFDHCSQIQI